MFVEHLGCVPAHIERLLLSVGNSLARPLEGPAALQLGLSVCQVLLLSGGESGEVEEGVGYGPCVADGGGVSLGVESDVPHATVGHLATVVDGGQR